jgi:arginyl-tRNA synthetase
LLQTEKHNKIKKNMKESNIRKKIEKLLENAFFEAFGQEHKDFDLGFPPEIEMGDFTLPCFILSKKLNLPPSEVAQKLQEKIPINEIIEKAKFQGPYLNLWIYNTLLFKNPIENVEKEKESYGFSQKGNKQKIILEYLGPNTNKPLHLGHARNGAIGMAIAKILGSQGYDVTKANLVNDRGIHICKSMLAWKKWGQGKTPQDENEKGDHFVGKFYVMYNTELEKNPHLEDEIREMLKLWEAKDKATRKIWKKMNDWVYEGFQETYAKFGLEFDVTYYESGIYELGKNIVQLGLEKGIFKKDGNGSLTFDLSENKFGRDENGQLKKITVIRKDGTSLYITQDLGLAVKRFNDYQFDRMIYVVGKEQIFHFQCLFEILRAFHYPWARDLHHLPYGMVSLPEGKMKSREGKVIDTDDLIAEVTRMAWEEVKKRDEKNELNDKEILTRANIIGIGSIKFYLLRFGAMQDICFDPKESISFDGVTGPYCQYAYARIQSILKKAKEEKIEINDPDYSKLGTEEERILIQKIIQYSAILEKASDTLNPSIVANHVYETARAFNQFYVTHKVAEIQNETLSAARISLIKSTARVIRSGLGLLGIQTLNRM